jgi:uncharacterized repeat protein (TIGR03833 family)
MTGHSSIGPRPRDYGRVAEDPELEPVRLSLCRRGGANRRLLVGRAVPNTYPEARIECSSFREGDSSEPGLSGGPRPTRCVPISTSTLCGCPIEILTGPVKGVSLVDGRNRRDVVRGADVSVVLKEDQPTGKQTRGIVQDLLTRSEFHPRGIKVRLQGGKVGRVQVIHSAGHP